MLSRLYTLALVFMIACSSWVMFEIGGIVIFALICILAGLLNQSKSLLRAIVYFLGLLFFIALLLPAISCAREAARRVSCMNNLKQLALALQNYHDKYGCFPPAYVADKNGRPMHSWRVLILPFMEYKGLYEQYDLNEPWDGPNNKKLLSTRPPEYACPSDRNAWGTGKGSTQTNYVAVVGADAAWSGEKPRTSDDANLKGKLGETIAIVEVSDADVNWTEPRDLSLEDLQTGGLSLTCLTVPSNHFFHNGFLFDDTPAGAQVAMADGSVRRVLARSLVPDQIRRMLKIGGLRPDEIGDLWGSEELRIHWPHCAALAVWIVSVGLLLYRAVRSRRKPIATAAENAN